MKMMRKLLSATLALVLGTAALGMTGCGDGGDDHVHTIGYAYNTTHHWLACEDCDYKQTEEAHENNGEGYCMGCESLIPTQDVTYAVSEDGTYALVTGYDYSGSHLVVVGYTYNGLPVKAIADSAFEGSSLERVILPKSVTTIGDSAFKDCSRMQGIMLYKKVTSIGDNAFDGCGDLTIFCEAESRPSGWSESWNPLECFTVWEYQEKRMAEVSGKAIPVADGMLVINDPEKTQLKKNEDLNGVKAPEGFSALTRYDAKTEEDDLLYAWTTTALWNYNYDQTDLRDYADVWFAAKVENAFWVFTTGERIHGSPWVYVHLKQTGETDYLGYILWDIEVSIGGYVFGTIENQSGKKIDADRPINSLALMLWDNGFGSEDGNALLFYSEHTDPISFYCTEVVGVRVGA